MTRTDIINLLANKINAQKYLEIGIGQGHNFKTINCNYKIGVDPNLATPATHHITSDVFFESNTEKFDIIFIDGLHLYEQVYRDINNSLLSLNNEGYIICHDMNPDYEALQLPHFQMGAWMGDCWKAFVRLHSERSDITMYTIDTDCGCSVIQKGSQQLLNVDLNSLNWENFDKNRKEWLNLITVNEFYGKL
jgi:predicted O-methyltransferase YrrM